MSDRLKKVADVIMQPYSKGGKLIAFYCGVLACILHAVSFKNLGYICGLILVFAQGFQGFLTPIGATEACLILHKFLSSLCVVNVFQCDFFKRISNWFFLVAAYINNKDKSIFH